MVLKKWNPFRFRRNKQKSGTLSVQHKSSTAAASPVEQLLRQWPVNHDWWRDPWPVLSSWEPSSMDRWFGDFTPARFTPSLDVIDEDGALRVSVDLPGLSKSDVEVVADGDYLTVRGEKKFDSACEEDGCYRIERAHGAFQRTIPLPEDVDVHHAEAKFESGVLTIRIPKKPESTRTAAKTIELQ